MEIETGATGMIEGIEAIVIVLEVIAVEEIVVVGIASVDQEETDQMMTGGATETRMRIEEEEAEVVVEEVMDAEKHSNGHEALHLRQRRRNQHQI